MTKQYSTRSRGLPLLLVFSVLLLAEEAAAQVPVRIHGAGVAKELNVNTPGISTPSSCPIDDSSLLASANRSGLAQNFSRAIAGEQQATNEHAGVTIIDSHRQHGLLFVIKRDGIAGFYYGERRDDCQDITHVIVRRDETALGAIFFDELGAPIHWLLPGKTFAMMTFGNPSSRKIMACDEGMTSLTFNLAALLEENIVQTLLDFGNFLGQAETVAREVLPQWQTQLEMVKQTVADFHWGSKTIRGALDAARTPQQQAMARWLATARVGLEIAKRFKVPTPDVVEVVMQSATYLTDIAEGKYERADIEGPRIPMLLCAGQGGIPHICNYFYLFNTPGNLMKCVNVCRVSLRCFTGICHPTFLSVEEVLEFRKRH